MGTQDIYIPWDGWKLKGQLGKGSFGRVYEIEKQSAGKTEKAAMKVITISTDMIEDLYGSKYDPDTARRLAEESLASIRREYDIMYELRDNPNIVRCDDMKVVGHQDGIGCDVYIMMELLTPLQKVWKHESLSEDDVVKLGKDICRALAACQKHHVIHRDIKPQNILVTESGDYKLGDFGTARTFENTTSATMAGTETYIAPEVLFRKKYGRDVDTYSLGLVMYRMLNKGQMPFIDADKIPTAEERAQSMQRRLNGEALPAPADGSRPLQAVVLKACSYERYDRYASAADMLEDLLLAEEGTMPMFSGASEDRSTVVDRTVEDPSSRTQTMTGRGPGASGSGTGKIGRRNGGSGKNTTSLSKKVIAAVAVVLILVIAALLGMGGGEDSTGGTDSGTAADSSAEESAAGTEEESTAEDDESDEPVNTEGINTENFLIAFRNGNYDEARSWGSENPEYVNESVVLNMPSDVAGAYENTAGDYAADSEGFTGMSGYTDIDNDGTAEMVVYTPGPEADTAIKIFTYDSGTVTEVGEISGGHSSVYAYPGHNGMVVGWGHMGSQTYSVVSIENGELKMEDFGSMDISEGEDYLYPGNMIWLNTIEQ